MSKSLLASATLFAIALSACAHQNTPIPQTTWEYGGGRAAQPGAFLSSNQRASYAQAPVTTRTGMSYLGGQAGEPQAWLDGDAWQAKNTEAASCQMAGRAAQPFSGPTLYAVTESEHGKVVACRPRAAHASDLACARGGPRVPAIIGTSPLAGQRRRLEAWQ